MEKGLKFRPMNSASIEIALLIDTGFATSRDMTSQLGFIMVFMVTKRMQTSYTMEV